MTYGVERFDCEGLGSEERGFFGEQSMDIRQLLSQRNDDQLFVDFLHAME